MASPRIRAVWPSMARSDIAFLAALTALSIAAALAGLMHRSLEHDELLSFYYAQPDTNWAFAVDSWRESTHLPTYYAVLRFWNEAFGEGQNASRLLSALALLFTAGLVYPYRKFMNAQQFRVFAAVLLLSPPLVFFGGQARAYIFLIAGSAAVFHFGFRTYRATAGDDTHSFAFLVASTVLLALTDFFGFVFSSAVVVILLARVYWTRRIIHKPTAMLLGALFVFPAWWTWFAWGKVGRQTGGRAWLHFELIHSIHAYLHFFFSWHYLLLILALCGFVVGFRRLVQTPQVVFAIAIVALYIAIVSLFSLYTPVLTWRTYLVLSIPVVVVVSAGIDAAIDFRMPGFPHWKTLLLCFVTLLFAITYYRAIRIGLRDGESWSEPAQFMAQSGCANAEILAYLEGTDVEGPDGKFIGDYYFRNVLKVPSPNFVPLDHVPMAAQGTPMRCLVKAFIVRGGFDTAKIWKTAQKTLNAPPAYRIVQYPHSYLLVDSADR
jgi:Dolichyl-phosphate-mannose-protein mannosyltransferase